MNRWNPCRRRDFIRHLRRLGFGGPFSGTRHQFMIFDNHRLPIPSSNDYSVAQLRFMLREVSEIIGHQITAEEWNSLE
jgi:hypothetical protein